MRGTPVMRNATRGWDEEQDCTDSRARGSRKGFSGSGGLTYGRYMNFVHSDMIDFSETMVV